MQNFVKSVLIKILGDMSESYHPDGKENIFTLC